MNPSVYFTPDHDLFRQTVREFLAREVTPHADQWEELGRVPREMFRKLGDMGFLGINFPERYGGGEADIFYAIAFLEELPRSLMGGFCAAVSVQQFMATAALYRFGHEGLRQRYLVPSIAGQKVGGLAITEPDAGSDVAAIRTAALRDGDHFVVNGAKTWITNGAEGDFFTVAVKTDRDAGPAGVSLLVIDADTPGVRITRRLRKMGWHSSDTAELAFENVRVPAGNLIGAPGRGFYYIMDAFQLERLVAAAIAVGSCDLALEKTLEYMGQRTAFGRPLARFQALRHRLADLCAEVEAARQLTYHCAWLHEQGKPAVRESSMAKLVATELNKRVADECLQFYGGFGYAEEFPLARFYRDARVSTIAGGTSEIMREILAKIVIDGAEFEAPARSPQPAGDAAATASTSPGSDEHGVPAPGSAEPGDPAPGSDEPGPPAPGSAEPGVPAPGSAEPGGPAPGSAGVPPPSDVSPPGFPADITDHMQGLPARLRPDKTAGWCARFHFRFADSAQPEWTVVVDGAACHVTAGIEGEPNCVVKTSADVYLGIERGTQDPQMAFLMGKVKVSNVGEMMRFMKAFRRLKTT